MDVRLTPVAFFWEGQSMSDRTVMMRGTFNQNQMSYGEEIIKNKRAVYRMKSRCHRVTPAKPLQATAHPIAARTVDHLPGYEPPSAAQLEESIMRKLIIAVAAALR
jgi:hypothetical protein